MKKNKLSLIGLTQTLIFLLLVFTLSGCMRSKTDPETTIDARLIQQGYSESEIRDFKASLKPDQILSLSIHPYQVRALERALYPYYEDLLTMGYTYTEAKALSQKDSGLLIQVMRLGHVDQILDWIHTAYLIPERFARYQAYASNHPSLTKRDIVERVNTNRDIPFYTQTVAVDFSSKPLLVNKYHGLPSTYVPTGLVHAQGCGQPTLVKEAADAYDLMCTDISKFGLTLNEATSYRSYAFQAS